jgi:hypothetical protein
MRGFDVNPQRGIIRGKRPATVKPFRELYNLPCRPNRTFRATRLAHADRRVGRAARRMLRWPTGLRPNACRTRLDVSFQGNSAFLANFRGPL